MMAGEFVVELATSAQLASLANHVDGRAQIRRCIDALNVEKRRQGGRRAEANAAIKRIEQKLAELGRALGPDGPA